MFYLSLYRPFSINNYSSALAPLGGVNSTDPYIYYGMRNPLDPDPGKSITVSVYHDVVISLFLLFEPVLSE